MTTLVTEPRVGDLESPDPGAVAYLESSLYQESLLEQAQDCESRCIRRMFDLRPDILRHADPENLIIIEPDPETLALAAEDFKHGFWEDIPETGQFKVSEANDRRLPFQVSR
jgi:hypothetical protein